MSSKIKRAGAQARPGRGAALTEEKEDKDAAEMEALLQQNRWELAAAGGDSSRCLATPPPPGSPPAASDLLLPQAAPGAGAAGGLA